MSVTVVTLLAIAGIGCVFVLTALLAMLRAAAHSDAQLDGARQRSHQEQRRNLAVATEATIPERPSTGRFARGRARRSETGDRPLVR